MDAIILSDIHLGSDICQAKRLCDFLEQIHHGEVPTAKLILNGDVFDSIDFRRLTKTHWKVLSLFRKLSDRIDIIWISGNHDGSAEVVSHLLGVTVAEEYVLHSGAHRMLILHGHRFDEFIDAHPIITWLSDVAYLMLQKIDRSHFFVKLAKKKSKAFIRCAKKIEEKSLAYARTKNCTAVCCGHTHQAVVNRAEPIQYFNCGCWTELPGTYLTVVDGTIELHAYEPVASTEVAEAAPAIA